MVRKSKLETDVAEWSKINATFLNCFDNADFFCFSLKNVGT